LGCSHTKELRRSKSGATNSSSSSKRGLNYGFCCSRRCSVVAEETKTDRLSKFEDLYAEVDYNSMLICKKSTQASDDEG